MCLYVCSKGEEKVFKRRFTKGVNLYTEGNCVVVIVLTHSYIDTHTRVRIFYVILIKRKRGWRNNDVYNMVMNGIMSFLWIDN